MPSRPASKPAIPKVTRSDQTSAAQHGARRGKLPHERDESADTQLPIPDQAIADKAHDDAVSERVDTDCALGGGKDCPGNPTGR